jgi:PAS domain-containing protein
MSIQCNTEVLDESLVEFLTTLVQSTQDAIVCVDEGHHLVLFNPAAESLFEYSAKEILGKRVNKILPLQHNNDERTVMFGKTKGGDSIPIDVTNSSMILNGNVYRASIIRKVNQGAVDEIEQYRKETKRRLLREVGQVANMGPARSQHSL